MQVGYLGPAYTHTEVAAKQALNELQDTWSAPATLVPLGSIEEVFQQVATKQITLGVVPLENVIAGPVVETLDQLYVHAQQVKIIAITLLSIEHCLGVLPQVNKDMLKRVYSKDQALKQCSDYLHTYTPPLATCEVASTTEAMDLLVRQNLRDSAAIGPREALRHYGLKIIAENISNINANKTRFAVLAPVEFFQEQARNLNNAESSTSLVVYPKRDRLGLLLELLEIISKQYQLNCAAIYSRPDTHGAFRFYLELEANLEHPSLRGLLPLLQERLKYTSGEIQVLGIYKRRFFAALPLKVMGIIGGTGVMGQWFANFFTHAGFKVLVSGRKTALSYEECLAEAEVILVNVPISETCQVLKRIAPKLRAGQLLVDNSSIKSGIVDCMLEIAPAGVEVLGMHTIFGPATPSLSEQNVIFVKTPRTGSLAEEFINIFYKYGAHITYSTAAYHDLQMAVHQNLEHFTKIVLAAVIAKKIKPAALEAAAPLPHRLAATLDAYASPNSKATLGALHRILQIKPDLCAEIQLQNPAGKEILQTYLELANHLGKEILNGNVEPLLAALKAGKDDFVNS